MHPPPLRVIIENLQPEVDAGRFPIKRVVGETVEVTADIHMDGQGVLAAVLRVRWVGETSWKETPLREDVNDLWTGSFTVNQLGRYEYTAQAWIDRFRTWRQQLSKKVEAGQEVSNEWIAGAELVGEAAARAEGADREALSRAAEILGGEGPLDLRRQTALNEELADRMKRYPDRRWAVEYDRFLPLIVERPRARFGSWYEMFPRSAGQDPQRSATFREAEGRLPGIAAMGFDVVYLPPVHPIGKTARRSPNNAGPAGPTDPGSPWAIGSLEGGHKTVDPQLGTLADFKHFREAAEALGMEVALDIAFQCSPDHPYVREHPEWFLHRADGTIQYAENPPKKYEDIYPLNFECDQWQALWAELRSVVVFWIEQGVKIFRVDNPHTKPYRFWEWLLQSIREDSPDVLFLAEAFTRPKIMRYLAKVGFSQSYTYFTWRNSKTELTEYLMELTQTPVREYLRPNFFTNTPDILHAFLQTGGRAAHQIRLILAATLAASCGIYGPSFELCENRAVPGTEEYQDSEKYQVRAWDWDRPGNIKDLITRVNRIRKENPALQFNEGLTFHPIDNGKMLFYMKKTTDLKNVILVVVNLNPFSAEAGWLKMPLKELGLADNKPYIVRDLLTDLQFTWKGESNFVRLDPSVLPAHILRLQDPLKGGT